MFFVGLAAGWAVEPESLPPRATAAVGERDDEDDDGEYQLSHGEFLSCLGGGGASSAGAGACVSRLASCVMP